MATLKLKDALGNTWEITVNSDGSLQTTASVGTEEVNVSHVTSLTGQELVKLTQSELAGWGNAATPQVILGHLNKAKDEVWAILKSLNEQYFMSQSQSDDVAADNYFPSLAMNQREYTLPPNLREIKFIEVISPTDQADTRFLYRKMNHPDFMETRRASNFDNVTSSRSDYLYTISGSNPQQFVLAQYPSQALTLRLWYIHAIPDFGLGDELDDIVAPFDRKLSEYACKRVLLANDLNRWEAWRTDWKESVISIMDSASQRNGADATYVVDFEG